MSHTAACDLQRRAIAQDLQNEREVSKARVEGFAQTIGAIVAETSSKENIGVNELFRRVTEEVVARRGSDLRVTGVAVRFGGPCLPCARAASTMKCYGR